MQVALVVPGHGGQFQSVFPLIEKSGFKEDIDKASNVSKVLEILL